MAITIGWIVILTLVGLAMMQAIFVWLHCRFLNSNDTDEFDESYIPNVAVLLCARGSDPSLPNCLTGLVKQTYEPFEIHVVVDDLHDPALILVNDFFAKEQRHRPTVHVLKEHAKSRSLKCSAIILGLEELDNSIEVVALIDADTVGDPNWLRDLVQPLADPAIGATTGNRWFSPTKRNLASVVRQAWNAAAVVQMTIYQIPWGGSLALKRSTIERCELLSCWSTAFCEDTMLTKILKHNDLRMFRVPDLVLVNNESTTMGSTFRWIVRQLLTVRLYHRDWPLVLTHGLISSVCMVAAPIVILAMYVNAEPIIASLVFAVLFLFEINNVCLLIAIQTANQRVVCQRNPSTSQFNSSRAGILPILVTQLLHPFAVIAATLTRRVSWRGIDYSIGPKKKITMLDYYPFCQADDSDQTRSGSRSIG